MIRVPRECFFFPISMANLITGHLKNTFGCFITISAMYPEIEDQLLFL